MNITFAMPKAQVVPQVSDEPRRAGALYRRHFGNNLRRLLTYLFAAGAVSIPIAAVGLSILFKLGHVTSSPPDDPHLGWVTNPESRERGTLNIVWVCISTVFTCVYVSVHVGIPAKKDGFLYKPFMQKGYWLLANIFAPELMVLIALCERCSASSGVMFMRRQKVKGWTMRLAFFADMGGFKVQFPDGHHEEDLVFDSGLAFYKWFSSHREQPKFNFKEVELDVKDRSKKNGVLKAFTCIQATWLLVQTVVRFVQHLPVTELEVTTCAYIICALVVYSCWLHKPYDIERRVTLRLYPDYRAERRPPEENIRLPIAPFPDSDSSIFNGAYYEPDKVILICCLLGCFVGFLTSTMLVVPFWNSQFLNSHGRWIWRACSLTQVSLAFGFGFIAFVEHWSHTSVLIMFQLSMVVLYDISRSMLFALICFSFADQPAGVYHSAHWIFGVIPHWN